MENQQKIVCFASGDSCHGCAHYHGKSEVCEHKKQVENQQTPEGKMSTSDLITVFEIVKKDFDKEVRKMEYSKEGQISVNNFYNVLNKVTVRLAYYQEANAKLVEVLREVEPLIDLIILTLPSGKNKNAVTDYNIKLKLLLQTYETK